MSEVVTTQETLTGPQVVDILKGLWEHRYKMTPLYDEYEALEDPLWDAIGEVAVLGTAFSLRKMPKEARDMIARRGIIKAELFFLRHQDNLMIEDINARLTPVLSPTTGAAPLLRAKAKPRFKTKTGDNRPIHNFKAKDEIEMIGRFSSVPASRSTFMDDENGRLIGIVDVFDWGKKGFYQQADLEVIYPK